LAERVGDLRHFGTILAGGLCDSELHASDARNFAPNPGRGSVAQCLGQARLETFPFLQQLFYPPHEVLGLCLERLCYRGEPLLQLPNGTERSAAGDRLDSADSCGDSRLASDAERADLARASHVSPATQLD
jgi:hypothetical protein